MPATILLDSDTIARTVERLGAEIEADHPDGVVLVGVLKGALLFVADLARAILDVPVEVDFISISRFAPDSGRVKILHDLGTDIGGRDVVLVEDIVDTGLTLAYLTSQLAMREPRSLVDLCAARSSESRASFPGPALSRCRARRGVRARVRTARARPVSQPSVHRVGDRADVAAAPDCYVDAAVPGPGRIRREPGGTVTAASDTRTEVL